MSRDRPPPTSAQSEGSREARKTLDEERRATAKTLKNVPQVVSLAPLRSSADRVVLKIALGIAGIVGLLILIGLVQVGLSQLG